MNTRTIDYDRMRREAPRLKRALTCAQKSGDPQKVLAACTEAVRVWNEIGAWPDNWHTWNIALQDARWADLRQSVTGTTNIPFSLDDIEGTS